MWSRAKLKRERGPKTTKSQVSAAREEKEEPGAETTRRKSISFSMSLRRKKRNFPMALI